MKVLALETSERIGSLAAFEVAGEAEISAVASASLPDGQRSAQSLLPAIQKLLAERSWQADQLDLICVTTGPGSFTGLRIGVTAAKTLAYATNAKLVEVHTLSNIAAGVTAQYERLWTLLDAQRQELFVASFEPGWQDQPDASPATRIIGAEQWLEELRPGDLVCGPPLKKLATKLPTGVEVTEPELWSPKAEAVGRLGLAAHRAGNVTDVMQLVPRYYRKSAAEEKADLQK